MRPMRTMPRMHCTRMCNRLFMLFILFVGSLLLLMAYRQKTSTYYTKVIQNGVYSLWKDPVGQAQGAIQKGDKKESVVKQNSTAKPTTVKPSTAKAPPPPIPPAKPKPKVKPPPCILSKLPLRGFPTIKLDAPPDVTVVTAFFDIGKFQKGGGAVFFKPDLYKNWAGVYRYLQNPLIVFTDSPDFEQYFRDMRKEMSNLTRIERVNRSSIWAFDYVEKVKSVISAKGYPRYPPNTVVPEYACVQHAKYWALQHVVESGMLSTTYVTWLDVGYFRLIANRKRKFVLVPPAGYDEHKMAVNTAYVNINFNTPVSSVFKGNAVWVGGGMLFSHRQNVVAFVKDYRRAVERYLNMNLSNTDQQVLLAMNTNSEKVALNASIQLQAYQWDIPGDCWFYLGYSCYREV